MKKKLLYSALIASSIVALSSCDPNDWNDKLDGFDGDKGITNKQMIAYTLTSADYANLAGNSANVAMAAADTLSKELKAVGTQGYFTDKITAREYIPNFLSDPDFAYFTLSDGSSLSITYRTAGNVPEEVVNFGAASEYTVSEADYQDAWGSDKDYIEAFSPEVSAQKNVPSILAAEYGDAQKGDMVIVNYKQSETEPSFNGGGDEPAPGYEMTSALGSASVGDNVTVKGLVTAICTRGFILTDNSGSIFVYYASGFDATAYKVGDQVAVAGEVSAYNKGLQITGTSATVNVTGNQEYSYPAAKTFDGAALDALLEVSDNQLAVYAQFTGKAVVSKYYNFEIEGATTAMGSLYMATDDQKAMFEDGKTYTISGYISSISGGKYVNFIATSAVEAKATKSRRAFRAATAVPTTSVAAVYSYNGSKWAANTSVNLLQASDYTAMGQSHPNLEKPDEYLPTYLKVKFPYAKSGDTKLVGYKYYASGKTSTVCDEYTFNGTLWQKTNGVVEETAQFVRTGGKWMYNPNVEITLPGGKGVEISTKYYQACVDWVYENIDKPLGSTGLKDGNFYVTKYGNNEYYCGTSAYQGNVDLRPAKAKEQYPAGYEGKSDEEIEQLMKDRFCKEVLPGALSKLHSDAAPVAGLDVVYTVNFAVYTGSTTNHTVRYKVVGQGKFEFMDCTWYE